MATWTRDREARSLQWIYQWWVSDGCHLLRITWIRGDSMPLWWRRQGRIGYNLLEIIACVDVCWLGDHDSKSASDQLIWTRCLGTLLGRSNVSYARQDIMLNVKLSLSLGLPAIRSPWGRFQHDSLQWQYSSDATSDYRRDNDTTHLDGYQKDQAVCK